MEFCVLIQRKNRNKKSQKTKQMLKIYWIVSGHIMFFILCLGAQRLEDD